MILISMRTVDFRRGILEERNEGSPAQKSGLPGKSPNERVTDPATASGTCKLVNTVAS